MPDHLLRDACSPHRPLAADAAEQAACRNWRRRHPSIHGGLYPVRYRDGANVSGLSHHVGDYPVTLPLLNVLQGETSDLGAAQPTAEHQRQDRLVASAFEVGGV